MDCLFVLFINLFLIQQHYRDFILSDDVLIDVTFNDVINGYDVLN